MEQQTPQREVPGGIAKWIRRLAIPIILVWIFIIAVLNVVVPQLEVVGQLRSVPLSPQDAPSMVAMKEVGHVFNEFKSTSSVMVVLEGDQPLSTKGRAGVATINGCRTCCARQVLDVVTGCAVGIHALNVDRVTGSSRDVLDRQCCLDSIAPLFAGTTRQFSRAVIRRRVVMRSS